MVVYKYAAFLVYFFTGLYSFPARAQQNVYSLAELSDSALHHMPLLLQKQALADAARSGIKDARHSFLPSALLSDELTLGTDNSLPGSYLTYGIIPSTSSSSRPTNEYQSALGNIAIFQSQYELLDFGLRKAMVDKARAYSDFAQADLEKQKYLLQWQVGKLYFEILKNQFQLSIEKENVSRYESIYRVIKSLTNSGIKAGADSSLALAELSKSRITHNQVDGQIQQLLQQLSYLTGIEKNSLMIETTDSNRDSLRIRQMPGYAAGNSNPVLDYFQKEEQFYKQTETLVGKSYLPKIFISATSWARGSSIDYNGDFQSLGEGLGYQRFNYLIGATFVYDLFNIVHRKDKLEISHYQTLASNYDLQQQELSMQNINNKAEEAIRTALDNLLEIPIQIRSSEETYNQKIAQYRAGIINLIDLTNASFVLYRAQSDYVQTISDWLLANLDKSAANGGLNTFIQSIKK
jgi:outer membrane protein TolC